MRDRPLKLVKPEGGAPLASAADAALHRTLRDARAGDVRAFATIVDLYYGRALRFALHMLGTRSDAEEAVQDAFVRLHRAFGSYREQDSFDAWFFRILANRCRTASARARRHAQFMEYGEVPDVADRDTGRQHDSMLAWREEITLALGALPPEQREAFLMRHVEALSYDDMAIATGAGISALKMRVKRACEAMRAMLTKDDHE